jgi:4-hydroxy-2-oxoheptanedioate aldolase
MAERLNGIIKALESGKPAFTTFAQPEDAVSLATSNYDGLVYELEHNPWDIKGLRDGLQYLLNRAQIAKSGTIAPSVTPMVRVPANGIEMNQSYAKQALDLGVYGIVWPHISDADQAYNAVAACRYPRMKDQPIYAPAGIRGDGPTTAARYWGLGQQDYYKKADVWPLSPEGEIFCILMIEDQMGVENLDDILTRVPGISAILIGEGDMSQELGVPRQYDHPLLRESMAKVVATCKKHNVVVGHPHVDSDNVERILDEGYRFLMAGAGRTYGALNKGLELSGRK